MPHPAMPPDPLDRDEGLERAGGPSAREWVVFTLRSMWRRKLVVLAVFVLGCAASFAYLRTRTRLWRVETMILAQRQQSLPTLVRSSFEDQPTRAAWELVHRRENLVHLLRQTGTLPAPGAVAPRTGLSGVVDRVFPQPQPSEEDRLNQMVRRLDRALSVSTGDGTITIALEWTDPQQAYDLVQGALERFMEERRVQEITSLDDVIAILEGRTSALRQRLEATLDEVKRETRQQAEPGARAVAPEAPSEEGTRLRSRIEAKARAVQDIEEFRRKRLADLQAQLDQKLSVLSEAHPSVMSLRQEIAALSRESPQVVGLRQEEAQLRAQYARTKDSALPASSPEPARPGARPVPIDENVKVRQAREDYQQMVERVNAARLELDAARAAFKFRYQVIQPAQFPRFPVSPNGRKILAVGVGLSLALAILAAAALDLLTGRVLEAWQLERTLGVPILGRVRRG